MCCATLGGILSSLMLMNFNQNISSTKSSGTGCQISIDTRKGDLKEPQPLILNDSYQIQYPDRTSTLEFSKGQSILLACPGRTNGLDIASESPQIRGATCVRQKIFRIGRKHYNFCSLGCKNRLKSVARRSGTCLDNFSQIDIGFEIPEAFIPILKICRDDNTHETYYVKAEMSKSISGGQTESARPGWMSRNLFPGHDINFLYTKNNQVNILGKILQSRKLARQYLKKHHLQRGHLAAKADFVYGTEQNSTFTLANAAPQWSSFNNGNWKYIEKAVRNFVAGSGLSVTIYTGVYGQMTLRDAKNEEKPIYLGISEEQHEYIRVPKFFWKIIYDPVRYLALAFIGVNDPFSEKITEDMFLCQDITGSPNLTWLTKSWDNRRNISLGVSYVCLYENLRKRVSTVPDLVVKGILRSYSR